MCSFAKRNTELFLFLFLATHLIFNPNPLGIPTRNIPESSKIHQCTFGTMPLTSKCAMHFRWSFIFSTYGLYFLPGSNVVPFQGESTNFQWHWIFPKKCHLEDFDGFGVVRVKRNRSESVVIIDTPLDVIALHSSVWFDLHINVVWLCNGAHLHWNCLSFSLKRSLMFLVYHILDVTHPGINTCKVSAWSCICFFCRYFCSYFVL